MRKSYFVSDLHLYARRSLAELHMEAIWESARSAETFVLGGDIFDFGWTTLASIEETVDAAIGWLHELVQPHPECQFHFVLGNHDSHGGFIERLGDLAEQLPNLSWHHYYLRLGQSLFLHGDVTNRKMCPDQLTRMRARWQHGIKRGPLPNALYDLALHARLHKVANSLVHRKPVVARRILSYLEHIGHGPDNGLRHVYFGHTHAAMSNFEYGGLLFHNGGAPLRGLEFRILEAELTTAPTAA